MFIDMHMHESTFSKDSFLKLDEMVELAKERGLGAICITDHDDMGLKEYAKEYSEKTGFPIFVGIEFFSLQGDIVALGIEEYPKERVDAQKFIDIVKEQGGICFSAHPFRNNNRGLEENLRMRCSTEAHFQRQTKKRQIMQENLDWSLLAQVTVIYRERSAFLQLIFRRRCARWKT